MGKFITSGKGRSASGTTTAGGATLGFKNQDDATINRAPLTVSGLGFKPTKIAIRKATNNLTSEHATTFFEGLDYAQDTAFDCPITYQNDNQGNELYQLDGVSAYTNNDGFQLPVELVANDYYWEAYE